MKLARFGADGRTSIGFVENDTVIDPDVTASYGVAVVPDAVFELCAPLQAEALSMKGSARRRETQMPRDFDFHAAHVPEWNLMA